MIGDIINVVGDEVPGICTRLDSQTFHQCRRAWTAALPDSRLADVEQTITLKWEQPFSLRSRSFDYMHQYTVFLDHVVFLKVVQDADDAWVEVHTAGNGLDRLEPTMKLSCTDLPQALGVRRALVEAIEAL